MVRTLEDVEFLLLLLLLLLIFSCSWSSCGADTFSIRVEELALGWPPDVAATILCTRAVSAFRINKLRNVGTSLGHSKSVVEEDDAYSMRDRVDDPTSEIASEM